jgi:hypothetical protein
MQINSLQCSHKKCRTVSASGERHRFTSVSSLNKHERNRTAHPCTPDIDECKCCEKWGQNRQGKQCIALHYCRHSKACGKFFKNETTLITHEINEKHFCDSECERCIDAKKAENNKRKREEVEEQNKRVEEERLKKRKQQLYEWKEKTLSLNWDEFFEQTKLLPEDEFLRKQAEICLLQMCKLETFEQCLAFLIRNDFNTIKYLTDNIKAFRTIIQNCNRPTIQVLSALKDKLLISDINWRYLASVFEIEDYATITYLKSFQKSINNEIPLNATPGGKGSELALYDLIKMVIEKKPPPDNSKPLLVKFAFDGATMTTGKRIKQEIGTLEFLYDGITLEQAKSPNNAYQLLVRP